MHFCTRTSLTEMRSKSSSRLTCTATAKQTLEYSQRLVIRNQLLNTHRHNMKLRHGSRHISITFIGTNHAITRFSHSKITSSHSSSSLHKLVAKMMAGTAGEISWVIISYFLRDSFLLKHLAHFFTLEMDGRHHDMARFLT